jgi:hypothetical protein
VYYGACNDTLSIYMSTKLQNLITSWPPNVVRTVAALKTDGFSQSLVAKYRRLGWLASCGDGAVIKRGDTPTAFGGLYALQHDMGLSVHLGGLSSLELLGRAHFVRLGTRRVWLFGTPKRLPRWFVNHDAWGSTIEYTSAKLFSDTASETRIEHQVGGFVIRISNELRAVLEVLASVPDKVSLDEARELVNGLTASNPRKVREMLLACTSIKSKRLFLALADAAGHAWMRNLDSMWIDPGRGPRTLVRGGKLHTKYKITLPESFFVGGEG